jgi:hypothetical protein
VPGAAYETDDAWYHRIDTDWARLAARAKGLPWADRLAGSVPLLAALTELVNSVPIRPGVSCHRDVNGGNVVRDGAGRNWLVDWDNHGPLEPWRELGALLIEHLPVPQRLGRLAAAYREDSRVDLLLPDGPELFATGLAVWLNFLAEQVTGVVESRDLGDEQRAWSAARADGLIGPFPTVADLASAAAMVSGSRAAGRA